MRTQAEKQTISLEIKAVKEINDISYFVVVYKTRECIVKQYPFQSNYKPSKMIVCNIPKCFGSKTKELVQDRQSILESLYEENLSYTFFVESLNKDSQLHKSYLSLKDDFGLFHRYYDPLPENLDDIGRTTELLINEITDGKLLFSKVKPLKKRESKVITEKEKKLFEILHEQREGLAKSFNTPAARGVWKSIIDKYPDSAHFIYELLQNADDAKATQVEIILDTDYIIFKHNGSVHFDVSKEPVNDEQIKNYGHINSITAIGLSSKSIDATGNQIGKFGVGFKAVFQYTSAPEIYDTKFRFRIDNYLVPTLLEKDHPLRKNNETLFFLPFKNSKKDYDEILKKLESLDNPILFLRHLKKIVWWKLSDSVTRNIYSKNVTKNFEKNDIRCELTTVNNCGNIQYLWMFTKLIKVEGISSFISLGYYLNRKKDDINTQIRPKVYCFFPTSESFDMCFVAHAPFLLVDSRQLIKRNEDINSYLVDELAQLAADTLPLLRDISLEQNCHLLNDNLLRIIPTLDYHYYGSDSDDIISKYSFYYPLRDAIITDNLLLSKDGRYLHTNDAVMPSPVKLMDFIDSSVLQQLYGRSPMDFVGTTLTSKDDIWDFLTEELKIIVLSSEKLAGLITSDFMSKRSLDWVFRLYHFLANDAMNLWKRQYKDQNLPFRYAPIIKAASGTWVPPYINNGNKNDDVLNVYYDNGNGASEFNIISKDIVKDVNAKIFLDDLGIKEPFKKDFIRSVIFPRYQGDEFDIDDDIIRNDFDFIYTYYFELNIIDSPQFISDVSEKLWLIGRNTDGERFLYRPSVLYFSSDNLNSYFKNNDDICYIELDFYEAIVSTKTKKNLNNFLKSIGVAAKPRIIELKNSPLSAKQRKALKIPYSTESKSVDYTMDGLDNALKHITKELSIMIWDWLAEEKDNILKYASLVYEYKYYTWKRITCESRLVETLKTKKWLYISNELVKVSDVDISSLTQNGYKHSDSLFKLLDIQYEKGSILALGGSEQQQNIYDIGALFASKDEAIKAKQALEEKNKKETRKRSEKLPQMLIDRKELPDSTLNEMFSQQEIHPNSNNIKLENSEIDTEEKIEKLKEKHNELVEKECQDELLRSETQNLPKYSFKWFTNLLKLEYDSKTEYINNSSSRAISISFDTIRKDANSDRIYILKNPSRLIPQHLEEIDRLEIKFTFSNQEEFSQIFEVANVRDYTLRVKAKLADAELLADIDWIRCTKATININNPVEIMGKLKTAFSAFEYPEEFNMKDNLKNNIRFIFGPPGTGKTTYLSKEISNLINKKKNCRILVLSPTNKACDVLTQKLMDTNEDYHWLGRFVATGYESIERNNVVCERDSLLCEEEKCCIVSTIARLPYDGFNNSLENIRLSDIPWDYIYIDEASMIPLVQIVFAIYKFEDTEIIISGDPMQISPIVREGLWKDENIYTMVKLNDFTNPQTEPIQFNVKCLDTQYRSIPAIGKLFSDYAYNGKLKHNRRQDSQRVLSIDKFSLKSINYIPFKVEKYDSLFGPKKLSGSNIHIYSGLLISEFAVYLSKQYVNNNNGGNPLRIGIICPYAAQAQFIDKLLEQNKTIPKDVEIIVGTIHGFQGDECDIIFAVFNPPVGLRSSSNNIFLNNKNIINVAISRAKDYLFIFLPHVDTPDYDKLHEIIKLGKLSMEQKSEIAKYTSDQMEKSMFGTNYFLEDNTFVTSHQLANVYSKAENRYEIRIDENAIDIQVDI